MSRFGHLHTARMAGLIAEAIEADGMTQAEFARRVGASTKHVNEVLNGKTAAGSAEAPGVVLVVAADDHDGQEAARRERQREADRALATEVMARVRADADVPDEAG